MAGYQNPFDIVKTWWGNKPAKSDTQSMHIDPSTKEGAFECLILGILYAINATGQDIRMTLDALRHSSLTKIKVLSDMNDELIGSAKHDWQSRPDGVDLLDWISGVSNNWKKLASIWKDHYFGGRLPNKVLHIVSTAKKINETLKGDVRDLYRACGEDGREVIEWLQSSGLGRKRFWMMREMRMRGVWSIDGKYCCVPDKQVGTSLERWRKIREWKSNLKVYLECSEEVWNSFGELYDLPVLHYAREHNCNSGSRRCLACKITVCAARQ